MFQMQVVHPWLWLLQDQGKLSEAEPLFLEELEARRRTLGAEHLDTLASINSMATLLQAQGELSEAEPLFLEALEASRLCVSVDYWVRSLRNAGQHGQTNMFLQASQWMVWLTP